MSSVVDTYSIYKIVFHMLYILVIFSLLPKVISDIAELDFVHTSTLPQNPTSKISLEVFYITRKSLKMHMNTIWNHKTYISDIIMGVRCKLESKIQEIEWQKRSEENFDQRKCYGLILFLAELVAQMDKDFASDISEILLVLIVKILRRPTSDITKYICQVLKVSCNN